MNTVKYLYSACLVLKLANCLLLPLALYGKSLKLFLDLGLGTMRYLLRYLHSYDGGVKPFKCGTAASKLIVVNVLKKLLSSFKTKELRIWRRVHHSVLGKE